MAEPENAAARLEGWSRYTERLFTGESPILPRLATLGIRLEDLRQTYETLSDNEDVEPEIGPEEPPPDFTAEREAVAAFLARAGADLPAEMPAGGWNEFQEAVRRALRIVALGDAPDATAFARILDALGRARNKGKDAGRLRIEFETLCRDTIEPGLRRWREYLHPILLNAIAPAAVEYAAWRRRNGRLNFQDLLLLARDLLRDHPQVRRDFQARFLPILVDEFQDTDPIQAEILFYLTGEDTEERDWRKLRPVPGSLFVVGDPKQSIYRFRRADIQTYGAVRARIEKSGRVLNLSANFRSTGRLCGWINTASRGSFPGGDAAAGRVGPARGAAGRGSSRRLSPRVADADLGHGAARRPGCGASRAVEAAVRENARRPEDFLILFRTRRHMSDYAPGARGTRDSVRVSGGGAFKDSEELRTLLPLLQALSDPDDPVPFVSVLRGPLFGVDDEALYLFPAPAARLPAALPAGADRGSRRPANSCGKARRSRPHCRPRPPSRSCADASAGRPTAPPASLATAAPEISSRRSPRPAPFRPKDSTSRPSSPSSTGSRARDTSRR
jgi:ATP-dependent helicase/nuclease subunit A